jgi:alpha/beta hydrolase family protein
MQRRQSWIVVGVMAISVAAAVVPARAQPAEGRACDDWLMPQREAKGKKVGPQSCMAQETALTVDGRPFVRLDIGLDGTVDGYLTKAGDYKEYLTNAPDLVFGQTADEGPIYFAVARYERAKGAAVTVVFPRERTAWNGKMWVTVHGRGASFKEGNLKAWDKNVDPADPLRDLNKYDRLMLAKGYALVKTRRTSSEGLGEIIATLEDGSTVDYAAFNDTANYIKDFSEVAQKVVEQRLGQAPRRTYFYGHSAGARIGRGLNYTPKLNTHRDGRVFFDGILADDGAAGGWLPVVMKDGKDVLFASDADKAAFVPQLDISHQMYNNIWPSKKAPYMSSSYLENKRNNARILREKGLGTKERMYEVRSISHSGGESLADGRRGEIQILDMSKLMDRFVDMLDAWVEKGTAPPATRSDWAVLGDVDRDGTIENPALAFPDVACPLGMYYPYPNSTAGTTAFAAFTGQGLEPLDQNKVFVDMNRNGVWDLRETPTQAWQRLGLLQKGQELTRAAYVSCVEKAADRLRQDGFFTESIVAWYKEQATKADLQPKQPGT